LSTSKFLIDQVFSEEKAAGVAFKNRVLKRQVINYLDEHGNVTIAELAKELNISTPKVTNLVNALIESGLIKDYGKVDSTGGRRASLYGLVADACYFIGVDVKHNYINLGVMDFKKNLVTSKMKVPYNLENTQESYKALIQIIKDFVEEIEYAPESILSAGINISGRVNHTTGYSYSFFNFSEEPLTLTIEKEIAVKTFLENDSRSMAFGEFCCGYVSTEKNVLFVNMDYGLGLGILIDGKVFYGKSGFSGEVGHVPFFNNEIICHCGKKGCLETEASGYALVRTFKEKIESGSSSGLLDKKDRLKNLRLLDIVEGVKNEDTLCIELVEEVGEKLGRGLAMLINIFNPELVVLGGTLSETGDYMRLPVKSALNKYALNLVSSDTNIVISKLGENAGIYGSCLLARVRILQNN
jgi:glucokinase-like ROK family protein